MPLVQTFCFGSPQPFLPQHQHNVARGAIPSSRTQCEFSRVTGYHNSFNDKYAGPFDALQSGEEFSPESVLSDQCPEILPEYSCSVGMEGPLSMKVERTTPFDALENAQWSDVYVVLQGTLLEICRLRTSKSRYKATTPPECVHSAGRLIKKYTLQHAEAGLAIDHKKVELVPRSAFTQLLAGSALEQLQSTEPQLFKAVKQYVVRLRLENEQLLFRFARKKDRLVWLSKLCAAIDIAPPLEYRAEPNYLNFPRRRRRGVRPQFGEVADGATSLVEDQEQSLTDDISAPQSAGHERTALHGSGTQSFRVDHDVDVLSSTSQDPDMDDLDASVVVGHAEPQIELYPNSTNDTSEAETRLQECPRLSSSTTSLAPRTTDSPDTSPAPPAIPEHSKLPPAIPTEPVRQLAYWRHCQPIMLFHSRRATDFIICNNQTMHIDWQDQVLRPYPEPSPPYQRLDGGGASASASPKDKSPVLSTVLHQILVQRTTSTAAALGHQSTVTSLAKRPLLGGFTSTALSSSSSSSSSAKLPSSGSRLSSTWKDVASWSRKLKIDKRSA